MLFKILYLICYVVEILLNLTKRIFFQGRVASVFISYVKDIENSLKGLDAVTIISTVIFAFYAMKFVQNLSKYYESKRKINLLHSDEDNIQDSFRQDVKSQLSNVQILNQIHFDFKDEGDSIETVKEKFQSL